MHIPHFAIVELDVMLFRIAVGLTKRGVERRCPHFEWTVHSSSEMIFITFASKVEQAQLAASKV